MSTITTYRNAAPQLRLPVFAQPWWLDVAAPEQWNAVLAYDDKGNITATWAFGLKQVGGMKRIFMPPYTPYLGPIFQYPAGLNEYDRRSFENKVAEQLIAQLPESKDIRFKWQPGADNWLPFFLDYFCRYIVEIKNYFILLSINKKL